MKFLASVSVYLLFAAIIGCGVVMMMHGKPGLLIGGVAVYTLLFAKIGCASH